MSHLLNIISRGSISQFLKSTQSDLNCTSQRQITFLFSWLNRIFNSVDNERLQKVGPDVSCAEWLLRNGATVRFKGQEEFVTDYNNLMALEELPESSFFRVEEIYARDAGLSESGFEHLQGCNHINKITLIYCTYLNNSCLRKLRYIDNSLEYLEIRSCFKIEDNGVMSLSQLRNLKTLILGDLVSVKKKNECEAFLKKSLTKCNVQFEK